MPFDRCTEIFFPKKWESKRPSNKLHDIYKKFQLSPNFFTLIVNFLRVCSQIVIVMWWCSVSVSSGVLLELEIFFLVEMNINIWYGSWSCRLYTTNSWLTVLNFCFSTTILLLHFSSHSWILLSIRYLTISKMSIFRCFVKSSKISIIFCFNSGFSFNFLSSALFSCNRATICDKWPKYYYIFLPSNS